MKKWCEFSPKKVCLTVFGSLFSAPAAFATPMAPNLNLAATFASLLFVILLIIGLTWLLKRIQSPMFGQQQGLKIISQLPIGTKERIAVIKVGEEQFLVGITPQSIQLISKLEKPLSEESIQSQPFANQLSSLLKKHEKA